MGDAKIALTWVDRAESARRELIYNGKEEEGKEEEGARP